MGTVKNVKIIYTTEDSDLKKTDKNFDNINKSAKDAGKSVDKMDKQTSKSLGNMEKNFLKVGAAIGGALAIKAFVGDAVQRIRGFQTAMADLSAITGAVGTDLEQFKKGVLDVSKNTGKSATEIAKAFQLVGSAKPELLASAEALAAVTEQSVILSKAGGIDVPTAADALTKSMNQFGVGAEEAAKFTDILATSQQKGTSTIDQTSEALKNVGSVAFAAGLSFEETNVALQALAKGGQVGAEAGTGLRGVLAKLSAQNDDSINPSITSLAEVVENLSNKNLTLKSATELVGLESAKALLTLTAQKDVVNTLTGSLNEVGNAAAQAETRFKTVDGQLEETEATYERWILSIEDGSGVLSQFTSEAIAGFGDLLESMIDLNEFDFSKVFDPESFAVFNRGLKDMIFTINGVLNPAIGEIGDKMLDLPVQQLDAQFSSLNVEQLKNSKVAFAVTEQYKALGLTTDEATQKYKELILAQGFVEKTTETETTAIEENTTATEDNKKAKEKAAKEREKQAKLEAEALKMIRDINLSLLEEGLNKELELEKAKFDDKIENAKVKFGEESEVLAALEEQRGDKLQDIRDKFTTKQLEKEEEDKQKKLEKDTEESEKFFEEEAAKFQRRVELEQAFADAKKEIDQQVAFSALDLAGALAAASGDSAQAQVAGLIFQKLAAAASVVINTQTASAAALAPPPLGLGPILGAPVAAGIQLKGAISIATILATAIPQFQAATAKKEKPAFREGVIDLSGPGTSTSDSIDARLSKGESVMTANETSQHKGLFQAIRNKNLDEYLQTEYLPNMYMNRLKAKGAKEVKIGDDLSVRELQKIRKKGLRMTNAGVIAKELREIADQNRFLSNYGG